MSTSDPRPPGVVARLLAAGGLRRGRRIAVAVLVGLVLVAVGVALAAPAAAQSPPPMLGQVIDRLRAWLVTLLATVATLFLTVGGLRYMTAGGDPAQVERAKSALRSAAIGYALAALSPVLIEILRGVVGG